MLVDMKQKWWDDVVPLQVQFEVSDATKRSFPDCTFDVVYSRDTILHIKDKLDLFRKFYVSAPTASRMCRPCVFVDLTLHTFSLIRVQSIWGDGTHVIKNKPLRFDRTKAGTTHRHNKQIENKRPKFIYISALCWTERCLSVILRNDSPFNPVRFTLFHEEQS